MTALFIFICVLVIVIHGVFWGIMTQGVADRKGLGSNWFAWGFFLGMVGYILASNEEDRLHKTYTGVSQEAAGLSKKQTRYVPSYTQLRNNSQTVVQNDFWTCTCGRVNASYISTCACGRMKEITAPSKIEKQTDEEQELKNFALIRELKGLLDDGIITEEEFDLKKKQLLGIDVSSVK